MNPLTILPSSSRPFYSNSLLKVAALFYHKLVRAVAYANAGRLRVRTDLEQQLWSECSRLLTNCVIYYNSAILSRLLTKYEASGNANALALITQISPAAWRHILLNGHYTFQSGGKLIDLDAIVAGLDLG